LRTSFFHLYLFVTKPPNIVTAMYPCKSPLDVPEEVSDMFSVRIDYDYDLISGKVNDVHYQNKQPDAFHHHYEYDADNRITQVYTSKYPNAFWKGYKDQFWDNDAKYFYYLHGPLARTEIGDDQVQGIDYAYTLQGWIKGVNSNTLEAKRDMGKDGYTPSNNSNKNQNFERDAFGYSLSYYNNDYSAASGIVWNNVTNRFEAYSGSTSMLKQNRYDLFNGNISSMVTTICDSVNNPLPQGMAYKYDQLNRLIQARAFADLDTITNTSGSVLPYLGRYENTFTYEANGNILSQQLKGQNGAMIDNLTYGYNRNANGKLLQNRLYHVNNSVVPNSQPNELNDEGAFHPASQTINTANNYGYDEIGELVRDDSAGIVKIVWSLYGKLKEVKRKQGIKSNSLKFDYDVNGNRIAKHVYSSANSWINSTYYLRDAQGNVMNVYTNRNNAYQLTEEDLYGSSRLGIRNDSLEMIGVVLDTTHFNRTIGRKNFEGSNHLGNVLTTFSDKKIPVVFLAIGRTDHFNADILTSSDYNSYGSNMDHRNFSGKKHRFGFENQEKDNEIYGAGNATSALFWEYDTRLGRRWNIDPVTKSQESPYSAFASNPVWITDPMGNDTALYQKGSGAELPSARKKSDSPKTPIWVVDENAKDYNAKNPWKTASPLKYEVGAKTKEKGISGKSFRPDHPLKGIGTKAGSQVFVEDLLEMKNEFYSLVNKGFADFSGLRHAESELDYNLNSKHLIFMGLVDGDKKYDLKSTITTDGTPSYAAIAIGEWSLLSGRLRRYDDYGNISYGIFGTYAKFSPSTLLSNASTAQFLDTHTPDEPRDQQMIKMGILIYNLYYHSKFENK
jgi:hypothetical protein